MNYTDIQDLKERINQLWNRSKRGESEALALIESHFDAKDIAWALQNQKLATRKSVDNRLFDTFIYSDNDVFLTKFRNNENYGTAILDVTNGWGNSRFVDDFDVMRLVDDIAHRDIVRN